MGRRHGRSGIRAATKHTTGSRVAVDGAADGGRQRGANGVHNVNGVQAK
jgi:hypothetical protein